MLLSIFLLLSTPAVDSLPFDLSRPSQIIELNDPELQEISGLGPTTQAGVLVAVSDERGEIYFLDVNDGGRILQRVLFREKGDFEGVEVVGSCLYGLRSDGRIYEMGLHNGADDKKGKAREIKTFLTKQHDVEGLGYDPVRKRLLVVGKGDPRENDPRPIYTFEHHDRQLDSQAVYVIHPNEVNTRVPYDPTEKHDFFSPSGIAVHPTTGQVYVISTALKRLVVLDGVSGHILEAVRLDKKLLPQPEGIAFDEQGHLWISCEQKDDKPARLLRFDARR